MGSMSEVYKALAHPTRRAILRMLREREMSAGEIAAQFDLSKPTLTGHFNILRDADLVDVQRRGTTLIYRLNASVLEGALLDLLEGFGMLADRPSLAQKAKA
jgi:ArsR family transcriptional regulator, arsenate/arsenite/antimonite-responsive transcriptional repressor